MIIFQQASQESRFVQTEGSTTTTVMLIAVHAFEC